jgi:hypothetical protein
VIDATIWPALAFLMGMFPPHGLGWRSDKAPIFSSQLDPTVKPAPLEMIQGMSLHHGRPAPASL